MVANRMSTPYLITSSCATYARYTGFVKLMVKNKGVFLLLWTLTKKHDMEKEMAIPYLQCYELWASNDDYVILMVEAASYRAQNYQKLPVPCSDILECREKHAERPLCSIKFIQQSFGAQFCLSYIYRLQDGQEPCRTVKALFQTK